MGAAPIEGCPGLSRPVPRYTRSRRRGGQGADVWAGVCDKQRLYVLPALPLPDALAAKRLRLQ